MSAANPPSNSTADAKDLLLEEYRAATDSLWKNEQTGETRVNWLIGTVTATIGGLVALASAEHCPRGAPLWATIIASLLALLVFGMITLLRIVRRNAVTDGHKQDIFSIRQVIKDHFYQEHVLLYHLAFVPQKGPRAADSKKDLSKSAAGKDTARKLGGLASVAVAINSLLAGALEGAITYLILVAIGLDAAGAVGFLCVGALAFGTGGLFFICQNAWLKNEHRKVKAKLAEGTATHAGGIVFRGEGETSLWLIVGPKKSKTTNSSERFFPRGHIEPGEGHAEAALREVREETGVVGRLVGLVDRIAFKAKNKDVDAKFYLMEWLYETEPAPDEDRKFEWLLAEDALKVFTHPESTHLLREAMRKRARLIALPKS
jgi:8-oxo-dGTP pyrophosphatase MutT (NUDIX family)